MTTTNKFSGYSDEDLLELLYETRILRGKCEQEIAHRFEARDTQVIETEHWRAVQRQDTERYVFSEEGVRNMQYAEQLSESNDLMAAARQISRPYVSLSKKETTKEQPL